MPTIPLPAELNDKLGSLGVVEGQVVRRNLPTRRITPVHHLSTEGLILKLYWLNEYPGGSNEPLTGKGRGVDGWAAAERDVREKRLDPLSGLGFAVYSRDAFNVNRWSNDPECLDVPVPQLYIFDGESWVKKPVEEAGVYCGGEKAVYDHEYDAWIKYLDSRREDADKILYLQNFLDEGIVV